MVIPLIIVTPVPPDILIRPMINSLSFLDDSLSNCIESLIDALCSFCTNNIKILIVSITESFNISQVKFFVLQIHFVDYNKFFWITVCVLAHLGPPEIFDIFERFFRPKFAADQNCIHTAVVGRGQGPEPLLARSVPKLDLYFWIVYCFGFEFLMGLGVRGGYIVDSYRVHVALLEDIVLLLVLREKNIFWIGVNGIFGVNWV